MLLLFLEVFQGFDVLVGFDKRLPAHLDLSRDELPLAFDMGNFRRQLSCKISPRGQGIDIQFAGMIEIAQFLQLGKPHLHRPFHGVREFVVAAENFGQHLPALIPAAAADGEESFEFELKFGHGRRLSQNVSQTAMPPHAEAVEL